MAIKAEARSVLSPQHLSHCHYSFTAAQATPQDQGQLGLFYFTSCLVLFWAAERERDQNFFRLIRVWAEPASRGRKSFLEAWKKACNYKALQWDRARPARVAFSPFPLCTLQTKREERQFCTDDLNSRSLWGNATAHLPHAAAWFFFFFLMLLFLNSLICCSSLTAGGYTNQSPAGT